MTERIRHWKQWAIGLGLCVALAGPARAGGEEPALAEANLAGLGPVRLVIAWDSAAMPPAAHPRLERTADGGSLPLPPLAGTGERPFARMGDATFADLDGDGVVDLLAVAQFVIDGKPAPLATVYLRRGDQFERSGDLETELNTPPVTGNWITSADAVSVLKGH